MKGSYLCLQFRDQFVGPTSRELIVDGSQDEAIAFNCFIQIIALMTHGWPRQGDPKGRLCQYIRNQPDMVS